MSTNENNTEGLDKTMRAGDEGNDRTLRQTVDGNDRTLRSDTTDNDSTIRQESTDKTVGLNIEEIQVSNTASDFVLKGKTYKNKRIISQNTGEAVIYLVEKDGQELVLKLYNPNVKPKLNLLEIIKSIKLSSLVKIFDYGEYENSITKTRHVYELMEFLEGETLEHAGVREKNKKNADILRDIAIKAATALHTCHVNQIIHKDIKPGNFFFRDKQQKELVLGDFGIASLCAEEDLIHQTQQARTPAYAAPEMYEDVIDNVVQITEKVDFYSLGITLMYVWLGGSPYKENERSLLSMKKSGNIPYPADAPEDIQTLFKGLTVVDPKKRWGFEEVKRWYAGEKVPVAENDLVRYKDFIFDPSKNQVARNPKELAALLLKEQKQGIRYLYSRTIEDWLKNSGNNPLALDLFDIREKKYPSNQESGLMAAIYTLDSELPYIAVDGTSCTSDKDVAKVLIKNIDQYTKSLKSPDNPLYIYLRTNQALDVDCYSFFKNDEPNIAIWKLIYTLDPDLPYHLELKSSKSKERYIRCRTTDDITELFRENSINEDSTNSFSDGRFLLWYSFQPNCDPDTYVKVENIINGDIKHKGNLIWIILYYLNPKVSYSLYFPEDGDLYDYSAPAVGDYLSRRTKEVFQEEGKEYLPQYDYYLTTYYLEARGMSELAGKVRECLKDYNYKKYGPYNDQIATYKIIKILGAYPAYYFKKSDKYVRSMEELKAIPKNEVQNEMRNGPLKNWIAVFYQERPGENSKNYEAQTIRYTNTLLELDSSNNEANRFNDAVGKADVIKKKTLRRFKTNKIFSIVFGLLFLIPALAIMVSLIINGFPYPDNPLPGAFWEVDSAYFWISGLLIFAFFWYANDFSNFIGCAICGAFGTVILYYIIYLIAAILWSFISIICIVLLAVLIFLVVKMCYQQISSSKGIRGSILSPDSNYSNQLQYAYHGTASDYKVANEGAIMDYYNDLKRQRKKILVWTIPCAILMFVLYPVLVDSSIFASSGSDEYVSNYMTNSERQKFIGTWEGIFDQKASTILIEECNENGKFKGAVSVKFKSWVKEQVVGEININGKSINFDDVVSNNVLDGNYYGSFDAEMDKITGSYKNKAGKTFSFSYTKK